MPRKSFSELNHKLMEKPLADEKLKVAQDKLEAEIHRHRMTLKEVRRARAVTQTDLAKRLNRSQPDISRIEVQNDMLLSTIEEYIVGMGGEVKLIARFPETEDIEITVPEILEKASGCESGDDPN